ncbi:hypothetical protein [Chamaesiphon sp. OTE_8_metabat_110]|uniref:hypothetical protein n=1 Tax=Chamaesiphon sp. OTE_8_metabat_110 TaxID=2964696 RepID=UPI002869FA17|nr:hypothetical protein [Chamaesiphon sp. OTE_8_metabat_110]
MRYIAAVDTSKSAQISIAPEKPETHMVGSAHPTLYANAAQPNLRQKDLFVSHLPSPISHLLPNCIDRLKQLPDLSPTAG